MNMSLRMFRDTVLSLQQCVDNWNGEKNGLLTEEEEAKNELIEMCHSIVYDQLLIYGDSDSNKSSEVVTCENCAQYKNSCLIGIKTPGTSGSCMYFEP